MHETFFAEQADKGKHSQMCICFHAIQTFFLSASFFSLAIASSFLLLLLPPPRFLLLDWLRGGDYSF